VDSAKEDNVCIQGSATIKERYLTEGSGTKDGVSIRDFRSLGKRSSWYHVREHREGFLQKF